MNAAEYRRQISRLRRRLEASPQPVAKRDRRESVHQVPGPPFGNRNRKWRQAPHRDVVFRGRNPMATPTPSSAACKAIP